VPWDHTDSNYGMARTAMLGQAPVPPENVHGIGFAGTPAEAAAAYERELQTYYGADTLDPARPLFDIVLLGMGPDGHTASLFPGHPQLHATGIAVCVRDSPKPPPERMTLTLGKLNEARRILMVVTGEQKAAMLARVLAGPDPELPASLLARDRLEVVADAAALGG
jgi:6-phosphogluconolactonase